MDRRNRHDELHSWRSPKFRLPAALSTLERSSLPAPLETRPRYRLLRARVVGRGGMGAVYAAFDTKLEREVALKVLHGGDVDAVNQQKMLLREARLAAKLQHPNIATVHEVDEQEGQLCIVVELHGGQRLLLEEIGDRRVDGREAHRHALLKRALAEVLGERGLADTARAAEEDVLTVLREVEREELLIDRPVDLAWEAPVEAVQRLHRAERRAFGACGEVGRVALTTFEGDDLLDGLRRREVSVR